MKNTIIALVVIVVLALLGWWIFGGSTTTDIDTNTDDTDRVEVRDPTDDEVVEEEPRDDGSVMLDGNVLGTSAGGRAIEKVTLGDGSDEIVLVGGIHGGYSWNTSELAYDMIDYFTANSSAIPANIRLTIIPVLNPDGLSKVVATEGEFESSDVNTSETARVAGRFNGNNVDLNRNFDCEWSENAVWQSRSVDPGDGPFSEPEAQAIRDYVRAAQPEAVVVYYSAAGGVYASDCGAGILPETRSIMNAYAGASGYPASEEFDFYALTGDMVNWLAGEGVPAISVLLTDHTGIELGKNRAGVEALLEFYADEA